MSLLVQNNYFQKKSVEADIRSRQTKGGDKVFSKDTSANKVSETEKADNITQEEELEQFKREIYGEISKITTHPTVGNVAIQISEDAFKRMKEEPEYKEKILSLLRRDLTGTYAPGKASLLIRVGSTLEDYRGDSWNINYDSEFHGRSQNSFYKKSYENKKDRQKELLEEYLQKQQEVRRIQKKIENENIEREYNNRKALISSNAVTAYNNQIFLYADNLI